MQVYALVSAHVVRLSGIDEEVGLSARLDTFGKERQAMLRHHRVVVISRDNLQFSLQVLRLAQEARLLVAFGVGLRRVHISFAVHHLVPFPVDDGTSCHAHLEHVGIVGHEGDGHESAEAPSVHAHAVGIDIGERLQKFHALHLVLHLYLSQLSERGLFEVASAVFAPSVVKDEDDVSLLCHVRLPRARAVVPAGIHVVGMRSAIDIDYGGVAFCGVEVGRFHHAVV